MRKIKILAVVLLLIFLTSFLFSCSKDISINKGAVALDLRDDIYNELKYIAENYEDRSIESLENEDNIIVYLKSKMEELEYSVEEQSFVEPFNGQTSKNLICKKQFETAKKTMVLGCQWDNSYSSSNKADGSYESGASLACLLAIAERLFHTANSRLNYEIVFFGAGTMNWSGAKYYVENLSSSKKDEIKIFINYAMLGGGDNLYIYSRDIKTEYNDLFMMIANAYQLNIKKVPSDKRIIKSTLSEDSIYDYVHIGMFGNNYYFMNSKIPSVNYLSLNWEDKSYPAFVEVKNASNVYETENDTLSNMEKRVGEKKIKDSLNDVVNSTMFTVLYNQNQLIETLENPKEVNTFGMGSAAYYITITFKILAVLAVVLIVMKARNMARKNKNKYEEIIELTKMINEQLNKEEDIDVFKEDNIEKTSNNKSDSDIDDDIFN